MHLGADSRMITIETHSVERADSTASAVYEASRRIFDGSVALLALLLLSPLLLIAATAVALTTWSWPLFTQDRIGRGGGTFRMYKLKSMRKDRRQRAENIGFEDRRRSHKTRNDPRVTPIGRFLRRSAIDELPQLWNVVKGDMALVGPRPELPNIVARYERWQHRRHDVRPGLTGWWQVMGPTNAPMHEHVEYDIYYVNARCWSLDLRIIFRTFGVLLHGRGRY